MIIRNMFVILSLIFLSNVSVFTQIPPAEFSKGMEYYSSNNPNAKYEFIKAIKVDSTFSGSYHFLGVLYFENKQLDSAIICFEKAIELNVENVKSSGEMTIVRLIDTYLNKFEYSKSFEIAVKYLKQYPNNKVILNTLKDVCLWAFYTKYGNLNKDYIASELKNEYTVSCVDQEYLILNRIRVEGKYLSMVEQRLEKEGDTRFDILTCKLSRTDKKQEVKFRLNWDFNSLLSTSYPTKDVYDNKDNPLVERLGAKLVEVDNFDLKSEVLKN